MCMHTYPYALLCITQAAYLCKNTRMVWTFYWHPLQPLTLSYNISLRCNSCCSCRRIRSCCCWRWHGRFGPLASVKLCKTFPVLANPIFASLPTHVAESEIKTWLKDGKLIYIFTLNNYGHYHWSLKQFR